MDPTAGLLAGLLHGAAGTIDEQRTTQRKNEDEEMGFRRHVLDTMMQSVAQGNSPPEFLPRILQDYAKTSPATPRPRAGGKAGFRGATQMPDLSSLMTGMGGSPAAPAGAGSPPSGAASAATGAGAGAAPAPPPQQPPSPAGTGSMAEAAGGLASLVPSPAAAAPPAGPAVAGGAPPSAPAAQLAPPQGPSAVPPPPPPTGVGPNEPFRFYTPEERVQMGVHADIAKKEAEDQAITAELQRAGATPEEIRRATLMRHGMKIQPSSRAIRTYMDQKTKQPLTWVIDPWTQEPVDATTRTPIDLNETLEGGGPRYIPAPQTATTVSASGDVSQITKSPFAGGSSVTPIVGGRGAGKPITTRFTFVKDNQGNFHAAQTSGPGAGRIGGETGVTGTVAAPPMEQVDTAVAAKQTLQEINTQINQDMRANPSANPTQLREQYAKQLGFSSYAELQKVAAQPQKRRSAAPAKPGGASAPTTFSPDNPFAPKK